MDVGSTRLKGRRGPAGRTSAKENAKQPNPAGDTPEAAQEAQKRTRNRLAQRAVRDRRTARIRHLEQQLAAFQHSDVDRFQESQDEIAKLRNGLYVARKKLFSLAATATKLANDIGPLLNLDSSNMDQDVVHLTQNAEGSSQEDLGRDQSASHAQGAPAPSMKIGETQVTNHVSGREHTGAFPGDDLASGQSQAAPFVPTTYVDEAPILIPDNENDALGTFSTFSDPSWLNVGSLAHSSSYTQGLSQRYPHSRFSDHLDFIQRILHQNGYGDKHSWWGTFKINPWLHYLLRSSSPPRVVELMLREFLETCWPAMGPWFAITDAYEIVKSICWWRLTKTSEALDAIQKSYRPTPIQQTLQYPSIIDWIPYAEIRDRLILNYESYDIDQIICDMAEAYVVDRVGLPGHASQPCNLLDLVQYSVQASMNPYAYQPAGASSSSCDDWKKRPVVDRAISIFSSQLPRPFKIPGFKIHPGFFGRYPTLFDPSAVAEDTLNIPRSSIRLQRALPLSQVATENYIKVLIRGTCLRVTEGELWD